MPVDRLSLDDFSGGYWPKRQAADFSDRQWSHMKGWVFEDERTLRTQWAWQQVGDPPMGVAFIDVAVVDNLLIALGDDGKFYWCDKPLSHATSTTTEAVSWTHLSSITTDTDLVIAGTVTLKEADTAGFVMGLLVNGVSRGTTSAFAIYEDRTTGNPAVEEWTDAYPADGGEDGVMPHANKCCMWGDFLVLGDIMWYEDDTAALDASNVKRFENALWFSEGGDTDNFDPLDVVFPNATSDDKAVQNVVEALVPIDAGLLVFSTGQVTLLRGTADDFDVEPLRLTIGPNEGSGAHYWPHAGSAVYMDKAGQVWSTNSEEFLRLDIGLDVDRSTDGTTDEVFGWHDNLLWSREGRLFAFHAFDVEGVWTELFPPGDGVTKFVDSGDQLYAIEVTEGAVWRMNRRDDLNDGGGGFTATERGQIAEVDVSPELATRTLELHPHRKTMWSRVGVRARAGSGTPTLDDVDMRPGPYQDGGSAWSYSPAEDVTGRFEWMGRLPGPSKELSVALTFTGDVVAESVSLWFHRGHDDR